jgi:flagellar hook protein FlgE
MLRSMFAAVSGLRSHQVMMDVVGNNIANINTVGYKSSSAIFADLLSQTINGAGSPTMALQGGTNEAQVGLGVRLQSIGMNFTQGASQLTGRSTDFAIQGDGMFIVSQAGAQAFSRAGSFSLDALGQLTTPDGALVQGWQAANGVVNTNASIASLRIPVGQTLPATTTATMRLGGNLPSDVATGTVITSSINTYNSLGTAVPLKVQYTKAANGANTVDWSVNVLDPDGNTIAGPLTLQFGTNGEIAAPAGRSFNVTQAQLNAIKVGGASIPGAWNGAGMTLDFGTATAADRLTGFATANSAAALSQDGSAMGSLVSFSVSNQGLISGVFSNGKNQALGQIALAAFSNPTGLEKAGGSLYRATVNSGNPLIGVPGTGGRGTMSGGTVEMSNVDLAQEFTNLIVSQRGFQANSRVITAADEILQDLVNMKR